MNAAEDVITLQRDVRVAHLQLNRPASLNAIDGHVCHRLIDHIDRLEEDAEVVALVISGRGDRSFSAGADLKHMRTLESGAALRRFIELTWRAFEHLANSRLISVAALHGHVLGGGLELALACDLRLADGTASIGLPELGLGSVPGSGALQRLPRLIGAARALEMIAMGRRLSATQAESIGLVNAAVAPGQAQAEALSWARTIAGHSGEALRYLKAGLQGGADMRMAAVWHGLVSDACHRDRRYQDNTSRFKQPMRE